MGRWCLITRRGRREGVVGVFELEATSAHDVGYFGVGVEIVDGVDASAVTTRAGGVASGVADGVVDEEGGVAISIPGFSNFLLCFVRTCS